MPIKGLPATCEDQANASNSEDDRTVPSSKISATKQKEDKKSSPKKHKSSSHRKETRSKSDDGTILDVEKSDDLVTSVDRVRVIPETKEQRRRSMVSAPVVTSHSPKKSSIRPPHRERGNSVTFDKDLPRRNRNDTSSSARKGEEDIRYTPNTSSSSRPRPSLTSTRPDMGPARPASFHAPLPFHYPPASYPTSLPYPSPMPFATPPVDPFGGSYFVPPAPTAPPAGNRMADRFSRTGQKTLNDTPLPALAPRGQWPAEYYAEDAYEEDEVDSEEDRQTARDGQRRREQYRLRKAMDIEEREQLRLKEREQIRLEERQQIRLEERERLEREERKRLKDSLSMPPPPGLPRRTSSQRQRPYTPESPTMEEIRERVRQHKRNSHDAPEYAPVRPKVTHHQTEPIKPLRRPSFNTPSASSGGHGLHGRRHADLEVPGTQDRHSNFYTATSGTGTSTTSGYYEEQERIAQEHQTRVSGEALGLTEALLQKQQKRIKAGRRSTPSTTSRDESDYNKRSIDIRTTRSGSGDGIDGFTLVLNGTAQLKIKGAEVNTKESDGPVEVSFNQATKAIRNGSEVASESQYGAPSRMSGSTAVSDDFMASSRQRNPRRESMSSHNSHSRQKPSVDDGRLPRSSTDQRLRDRMNGPPGVSRRNTLMDSRRSVNYEQWPAAFN